MAASANHLDDHHLAVGKAAAALDIAMKTAANEPARIALQVTYWKAVLASGRTNGIKTGAVQALINLGSAPSDLRDGDV
jgi:hypothetical protein